MIVRPERPDDFEAVARLVEDAFGRRDEALVVERVRASDRYVPELTFVAAEAGVVVGHVMLRIRRRGSAEARPPATSNSLLLAQEGDEQPEREQLSTVRSEFAHGQLSFEAETADPLTEIPPSTLSVWQSSRPARSIRTLSTSCWTPSRRTTRRSTGSF